ncbi:serine-threonine/tyrosine-protein kinase catalytic domain-containing protein, partial [Tanacetum coccineum]
MSFPTNQEEVESSMSLESPQPCRKLTFSDVQLATQNFDESLVIGCGGFGKVYKGTIPNGESPLVVAVKRLDSTSNQGAHEFWAEVKMLSNLRHCHLVSLIGYCNHGQEMILVYEYMSYGTLEDHLHKSQTFLPWVRRLTICIGAARGLDYLHTGTGIKHGIVHRDVKSSNILLHNSWEAKISDFGLSKICPKNKQSTYVKTNVKGTFGYLDPNYFYTGKLTRKSDVYAFGVVLFEALCGKRAVDSSLDEEQWGLAIWVQDSIKEGRLKQIVDDHIKREISPKCLKMFAQLAKRCLDKHLKQRPTMAEIVVGLESVLAIQEKANNMPGGITIFGRKAPVVLFPSNNKNSGITSSSFSNNVYFIQQQLNFFSNFRSNNLNSVELYFETVGQENQILHCFDYETISVATGNFSYQNKFSQLASDSLYKGKLQNGQDIVIAGPSLGSRYTENYMNEASILVKLEHENLAKLLGYCIEETSLFLIYEFQLYTSLDSLLF